MRILVILQFLFYTATSLGQCLPIYDVHFKELVCVERGDLCINLSIEDNSGPDGLLCPENYNFYVQIEFDESEFLDINPYDFYLVQDGGPVLPEIWESKVTWKYGGHNHCFEGEFWHLGAPITIRFIDRTIFPYEIVHEKVIKNIHELRSVGSGGEVRLSSLLGNQLLDPSESISQGQNIRVDGTLIVDEEYIFGSSGIGDRNLIIFTEGSGMSIENDNGVEFYRTTLSTCDETWEGIDIESNGYCRLKDVKLELAKKGLDLQSNGSVEIRSTIFYNNKYAIYCNHSQRTEVDLNILTDTDPIGELGGRVVFKSDNNSPFLFDYGIYLNKVGRVEIGHWTLFNGLDTGVFARQTDLFVSGGSINNNYLPKPQFVNGVTGVYAESCGNLSVNADFDQLNTGVDSYNNDLVSISQSDFTFCNLGVRFRTFKPHQYGLLQNNRMDFSNHTGFLGMLRESRGNIEFNKMENNLGNIYLFGLGNERQQWNISQNSILNSTIGVNIYLRFMSRSRIHKNQNTNADYHSNFIIEGGVLNRMTCNIINQTGDSAAIVLNGSPMAEIRCNNTTATTAENISVKNNNGQSQLIVNPMTTSGPNLIYDDRALTGPQEFNNNLFDPSSQGKPKAIHLGASSLSQLSQFLIPSYSNGMQVQQGEILFPHFTSSYGSWCTPQQATKFPGCNGCIPGYAGGDPVPDVTLEENANVIYEYINSGLAGGYGQEVEFDAKLKLMRSLIQLDEDNNLSGTLLTYYLANQNTEEYHFSYLEKELNNAVELSTNDQTLLDSLITQWREDVDEYSSLIYYSIDTFSGELIIDTPAMVLRDQLLVSIENWSQQINNLRATAVANDVVALNNMISYNNGIVTSTVSGANLKAILDIYMRMSLAGESTLNATDLLTTKNIGSMCYLEGGEAVWLARNLESSHLGEEVFYSDNCNSAMTNTDDQNGDLGFVLQPNPAMIGDAVQVVADDISNPIELHVLDISGRLIWKGTSEQKIFTEGWSSGAYQVIGLDNNVPRPIGILVIQ